MNNPVDIVFNENESTLGSDNGGTSHQSRALLLKRVVVAGIYKTRIF